MQLLDYIKTLTPQELEAFASKCETTCNYLWKLGRGFKRGLRAQPELCVLIEWHSNQKVRRWESNPERWHRIWPEIIGSSGAPDVAANDPQGISQEAA